MDLPFKPIEGSIVIYFGIHHKHDKLNYEEIFLQDYNWLLLQSFFWNAFSIFN